MKKLANDIKVDSGLISQALNNTNATGPYYGMSHWRMALAVLIVGAMAITKTFKIEFLQAKDAEGDGSKAITGAEATITANTGVSKATVTLATFLAASTVTINDLVFTAHATVTTVASREFSISGSDTADALELVACINDPVYGVPGVLAESALGVVTLTATEPGEKTITVTSSDGTTGACATLAAIAYVEIDASHLDLANDFTHVAVKVTTTANSNAAADLIRGCGRYSPDQQVGASKIL